MPTTNAGADLQVGYRSVFYHVGRYDEALRMRLGRGGGTIKWMICSAGSYWPSLVEMHPQESLQILLSEDETANGHAYEWVSGVGETTTFKFSDA
jgi:hypothetical protein